MVKWLDEKHNTSRKLKLPKEFGIWPEKEFPFKVRTLSLEALEME